MPIESGEIMNNEYDSLIMQLKDPDPAEKAFAATELGTLGDLRAVKPLLYELAQLQYDDDCDYNTGMVIVDSLAQLGDKSAVAGILQALELTAGDDLVPQSAIEALRKLGDVRIVPALKLLILRPEFLCHAAELTLLIASLDDSQDTKDFFVKLLSNKKAKLKSAGLRAVRELFISSALPKVTKLCSAKDEEVAFQAVMTLARLEISKSADVFLQTLRNTKSYFQKESLLEITCGLHNEDLGKQLFKLSEEDDFVSLRPQLLKAAFKLGYEPARARLLSLVEQVDEVAENRMLAACILFKEGDELMLSRLFGFITSNCGASKYYERSHSEYVPPAEYRGKCKIVSVLQGILRRKDKDYLSILLLLDKVRRGSFGSPPPLRQAAQSVIEKETKTQTFSEFDKLYGQCTQV